MKPGAGIPSPGPASLIKLYPRQLRRTLIQHKLSWMPARIVEAGRQFGVGVIYAKGQRLSPQVSSPPSLVESKSRPGSAAQGHPSLKPDKVRRCDRQMPRQTGIPVRGRTVSGGSAAAAEL